MSTSISDLQKRKKRGLRNAILAIIAVALVAALVLYQRHVQGLDKVKEEPVSVMNADIEKGQIAKINIQPDFLFQKFEVELKDGTKYKVTGAHFESKDTRELTAKGIRLNYDSPASDLRALPSYIMLGLFAVLIFMQVGQSFGISFMKAAKLSDVRFKDVAGNDEAKSAAQELVDYLKDPTKYESIGAKFPKGIIMDGPPGTGKTLLAKAIAGEANANFLAVSGSDFSSMFVGVSGMKVRGMFARAARAAPCVLFIDEIDAIGGHRLSEGTASAREMGSTLNSLLTQMDGFMPNSGVVVIAATNRIELLDPALLRSGRFDRHIHVQLPTLKEREQILKLHAAKIKVGEFDFTAVAKVCIQMSGADLANVMNQAALIALNKGSVEVTTAHGLAGRDRLIMGDARHSQARSMSLELRRTLARHEVGHALTGMVYGPYQVTRISILPRGQSLGQTMLNPQEDALLHRDKDLYGQIRVLLGGRAGEISADNTQTTGASDDLKRATALAMDLVARYGMRDGRLLVVTEKSSDSLRREVEFEAELILGNCLGEARAAINKYRDLYDRMVDELLEKEELDEERVTAFYHEIYGSRLSAAKPTQPVEPVQITEVDMIEQISPLPADDVDDNLKVD